MAASKPPNGFVHGMRKVYNPIGFKKGYNFTFWFIFAVGLFGFCLARVQYLSIGGKFKDGSSPGEWFYLRDGHERIGITLHLATIIPAGFLLVFQFVPAIRYKFLIFHRINGYVLVVLLLLSNAGALMIARHTFGGELETQAWTGLLAILTTVGAIMAYINIKRLQVDQHRAWMIRTWMYAGCIVTLRIIMIISALIVSQSSRSYQVWPCEKLAYVFEDDDATFRDRYPACFITNGTTDGNVAVRAKFGEVGAEIGASLGFSFGTAGWLALFLHAVGVEMYLALTPHESNRLRTVSYHRQLEAGYSHPGSSGLPADRFGDAEPWQPPPNEKVENPEIKPVASEGSQHSVERE
ncbi:MAG: hypothetical protein Q9200_000702 [Gallowayella weberi]